ncbi:sodium-dependent lysophosphatidylcholine symporter 1-A isoform X8 [Tachysurus ichikawai]
MSTPFAVLSYFLIWVVPPVEKGKMLWYLFFYCMFQSTDDLTMFISSEQKERDSATAYRMTVEVFGTVLGTAIQGQIVGGATAPCLNYTSFLNDSYNVMQLNSEVNVSHHIGGYNMSIVKAECLSFVESLKLLQKHGPYVKLVTGFLFTSLAFMLMEGNFALFLTYTLGLRGEFQNVLLVILPDSVKLTLKLLVSAVPVSFIILGLLIFRSYPINEERRHNRQRLHALLHDSSEDSEGSSI